MMNRLTMTVDDEVLGKARILALQQEYTNKTRPCRGARHGARDELHPLLY